MLDLSATGLRIQSVAVLARDMVIDGALDLGDGRRIALRGKVVWTTPPDHANYVLAQTGIEFTDVPTQYLETIGSLFADER